MCSAIQFLNWNIDKHLPTTVFKYNWKSEELHLEKKLQLNLIWNSWTSFLSFFTCCERVLSNSAVTPAHPHPPPLTQNIFTPSPTHPK